MNGYFRAARAVKNFRKRSGRTLKELGEELGVHQSFVSRVEAGEKRPSVASLARWVRVTGVPAAVFYPELSELLQAKESLE